jgi:hypothetical protein
MVNVSLVVAGLIAGKIITNFSEGRPGLAGFRVESDLGRG